MLDNFYTSSFEEYYIKAFFFLGEDCTRLGTTAQPAFLNEKHKF